MNDLCLGQIVRSTAGRDKDRYFVIVDFVPNKTGFVFLSDGEIRSIEKPKLKKLKHIAKTNVVDSVLSKKFRNHEGVQNYEIKNVLNSLNNISVSNIEHEEIY